MINWIAVTHGPDGVLEHRAAGAVPVVAELISRSASPCWRSSGYLVWRLPDTRLGRAMRAVATTNSQPASPASTSTAPRSTPSRFAPLLGGIGGALFAGGFAYVSPDQFSFAESDRVPDHGAARRRRARRSGRSIGTGLLILIPEWLRFLKSVPGLYLAIYGLAVILIMLFMPDGIWGWIVQRHAAVPPRRAGRGRRRRRWSCARSAGHDPDVLAHRGVGQAFRRAEGGGRHRLRRPARQRARADRPQRLRQDDDAERALGHLHAHRGPDRARRDRHHRPAAAPADRSRGLGATFQNIRLFRSMTALENVVIGAEHPRQPASREAHHALETRARAALDFVGLGDRGDELVTSFSLRPPAPDRDRPRARRQSDAAAAGRAGGGPELTPRRRSSHDLLKRIAAQGLTILLIDHDMTLVSDVAEHITVLNFGTQDRRRRPRLACCSHPDVVAAYLGKPSRCRSLNARTSWSATARSKRSMA